MTSQLHQPGVYLDEVRWPVPSIAPLESALPAFIGYTEQAVTALGADCTRQPVTIASVAEFELVFGAAAAPALEVAATLDAGTGAVQASIGPPSNPFFLAHAVQHFFANGGLRCVVVSVGGYAQGRVQLGDSQSGLRSGLEVVAAEQAVNLIVIPEAVLLDEAAYSSLTQAMVQQCAALQNRFALLDLREGDQTKSPERLAQDRALWGPQHPGLRYGAAYHPWLRTSLRHPSLPGDPNVQLRLNGAPPVPLATLRLAQPSVYRAAQAALAAQTVVLPPSAAVAGVYAKTDTERGVWKAPANCSLESTVGLTVALSRAEQELMNIDVQDGRSINAILNFPGRGNLVWGARTLAGNDNEWRYVPVRRFFTAVENALKAGTTWVVFEPNDANTWGKLRASVENFLTRLWRDGALSGSRTDQAFYVQCGLGQTMTPADVAAGRLHLEVGLAVLRPAEFTIFKMTLATMQA